MELNKEQKKAVQHDKGPMLIIAGAGTGKTRVITSRILELIKTEKAKPGEILALTFTEKAANEMVERVDLSMPLGYEELNIKTFHSFSDKILKESGMEMGIDPGFKIMDTVDQWFFFKKNLFAFDLDYYRPLGNPNRFIYDILGHFGKLRDELISPEMYAKYAGGMRSEDKEKMIEIAGVYKMYQQLKVEDNFLDFGDLTYYAVDLLRRRESVLQKYRDRFKYILVDEFQDTNYAQFQLVMMLAEAHGNIVVVGDDDQSIYKWRGASLSNILQFQEKFPEHENVVLIENYRSTQEILDGAYSLIQNNNPDRLEEKVGIDKRIKSNIEAGDKIAVHHFPSFVQEIGFVAEKIKDLHEKEGVSYGDCAILIRTNMMAGPFIDELKAFDVPYQVKSPKGLMSLDEIKDLIAVVKFLANPKDDISMLRILKMAVFDVPMSEILELLNNPEKKLLYEVAAGEVKEVLEKLIEFSKDKTVGVTVNEFLNMSGHLRYLMENDRFEEVENINEFAKQVARFEKENEHNSIVDFVNYLNLLEESNSSLPISGQADRDSVQILTVHGAKGLEFENVFIVNTVSGRFPGTNRSDTFEIPEELTKEIFPEGDVHVQEERRLFYVAMTRAKKRLFISYSDQYEGPKKWKMSPFVQEVIDSGKADVHDHKETEDAITRLRQFKAPNKPIFDLPPFRSTKLSYSQLDTFKTCPLKYNYRYVMSVPIPPSFAANFGSSVHETLKDFYHTLERGDEVSLELMNELFDKHWIPYGYDSKEHEEKNKEKGREMLEAFFEANKDPWIVPAFMERSFNLKIGEFWLNGRIDRIDQLEDGTYEVIDYKTGRMPKTLNLKKDLQLSVYAMACRDVLGIKVSKLSLYYLEDNEKVSTERSDADIDAMYDEIGEVIKEIEGSDFGATPGFWCGFCDFRLICPAI